VFSQKAPVKRKYLSFSRGGGLSNFSIDYFYVQEEYIAVYNNKKKKQTRELCVRACVSLSVSLSVPLRAQYVRKPKNNFAKMNEEKKKITIKKTRRRLRAEEEKEKKGKKQQLHNTTLNPNRLRKPLFPRVVFYKQRTRYRRKKFYETW